MGSSAAPSKTPTPDVRSRRELWKASIKVPMYTVAVTPITVGSLAAFADTGELSVSTLAKFVLAAVLIIAWLNTTNDVFDFDTGVDVHKRESIVNLCGASKSARNALLAAANCVLGVAFLCLYRLSTVPDFDPTVPAIIGVAVFWGYAYQGPPFRLSYVGGGEPICFCTWFISTAAAYYSQYRLVPRIAATLAASGDSNATKLRASLGLLLGMLLRPTQSSLFASCLLVALATTIILFSSHFHQIDDDRAAGKMSPIVRLGTLRASYVLRGAIVFFYVFQCAFFLQGTLNVYSATLSMLPVPIAVHLARFVSLYHSKPERVFVLKYIAVKHHMVHGATMSLGMCIAGASRAFRGP